MKDLLDIDILSGGTNDRCNCLENLPLAYAYVPYQNYESPYDMETSLSKGTVFPALNKPYGVYGKEFGKNNGGVKLW